MAFLVILAAVAILAALLVLLACLDVAAGVDELGELAREDRRRVHDGATAAS